MNDDVSRGKIFKCLGASNHTKDIREELDFYATHPSAANLLMEVEQFNDLIWEPAVGNGHLAIELKKQYRVFCSDIIKREYPCLELDFLNLNENIKNLPINIITNPPYEFAKDFIKTSLNLVADKYKVCMFLKLTFCEGKKRKEMFLKTPPKTIYISSSRIQVAKGGDFNYFKEKGGSAVCYAWYVWEKGFNGNTSLKWIN